MPDMQGPCTEVPHAPEGNPLLAAEHTDNFLCEPGAYLLHIRLSCGCVPCLLLGKDC